MTSERWDKVHTVSLYSNGPLLGVADVNGVPHLYEKVFNEEEDSYVERYRVMPIDQQLYALLMERWSIFARWRAAHPGRKLEAYPALPEDRDRYSFLDQAIGNRDKAPPRSITSTWRPVQADQFGPVLCSGTVGSAMAGPDSGVGPSRRRTK